MATTMKGAYATSGQIFKQVTMRTQPNLMGQLEGIEKGELVVVRGQHDHVEKLLDTLHLPYTMIEPDQIPSHQGGRVMIVNCARYAPAPKKEEALRMFVEEGGRLVTTDWAVELVSRAFPGTLKKTQSTN
ncbi:MAG: hypothetical protein Q7J78_01960, partial [Clostridiales bacterium]|nr:hypothetical protein [Clostridiales bacterium]